MQRNPLHRYRLAFCLLAVLLVFAACAPATIEQPAGRTPEGAFSVSGMEVLPDRWWQTFQDPTLNRLVDRALSDNLSLKRTWARLDQAQAIARKSKAALWPEVNARADLSKARRYDGSETNTTQDAEIALAASFELDFWGRIRSSTEAARLDAMGSAEDLHTAALTLTAEVATTWFQLLEQQEQAELLQRQLKVNQQTLALVDLQFRTGQVGIADLLQQRQVVENRRGELALSSAQEGVLENQLSILLGTTPGSLHEVSGQLLENLPPLPATGLYSDLLLRRPDIRSAWLRLQAADQRVASAVADRFPRLSLTARTATSGEGVADLFDNWLANIAANLVAPLLDGGQRRAEVERTRGAATEAFHSYGQTILEAIAEVEDALIREKKLLEHLESIDRQLVLAGQATERIRDRYLNGIENYQRVLTSTLAEQQLQRTRVSARGDLVVNRIKLCRALAGGWDMSRSSNDK